MVLLRPRQHIWLRKLPIHHQYHLRLKDLLRVRSTGRTSTNSCHFPSQRLMHWILMKIRLKQTPARRIIRLRSFRESLIELFSLDLNHFIIYESKSVSLQWISPPSKCRYLTRDSEGRDPRGGAHRYAFNLLPNKDLQNNHFDAATIHLPFSCELQLIGHTSLYPRQSSESATWRYRTASPAFYSHSALPWQRWFSSSILCGWITEERQISAAFIATEV